MTQGLVNVWALAQYKTELGRDYKPLWNIFLQAIVNTSYAQTA